MCAAEIPGAWHTLLKGTCSPVVYISKRDVLMADRQDIVFGKMSFLESWLSVSGSGFEPFVFLFERV